MQYENGEQVKLGDLVDLGRIDHYNQNNQGVVVVLIEEGQTMSDYKIEDWAYLKTGLILKTNLLGEMRYEDFDEDTVLISRQVPGK